MSGQAELLLPFTALASAEDLNHPYSHSYYLVGRLAPGVSVERAAQAMILYGARIHSAFPLGGGFAGSSAWSARAVPLDATRVSPLIRRSLLVLLGAGVFVLLITCANLASLLLARAATRQREFALRLAIGAGRARLVRLLLIEGAALACVGGAVGLLVAWWGARALSQVNPAETLQVQGLAGLGVVDFASIHLNGAALRFAGCLTLAVTLLFGLAPGLQATRLQLNGALKGGAVAAGLAGIRGLTSRRVLVVLELALALILLAGSGLMIRSLILMLRVDPGFEANRVLTFRLALSPGSTARDSLPQFYDELLARLEALPGVAAAGLSDCAPLSDGCNGTGLERLDRPRIPGVQPHDIGVHWTTSKWFELLEVPLKRGRLFGATDRLGSAKMVLINEAAARRIFPNEDPIGRRVAVGQGGFADGATIIGVVGDVRFGRIDSSPTPDVYLSYYQSPRPRLVVHLRTFGDATAIIEQARAAVRELAPEAPLHDVQTMTERVATASAQTRLATTLLVLFASVALVLAALGTYGVISHAVTQRTREIGIRMAIGADRRSVLAMVMREAGLLGFTGVIIGLSGALALTRVMRGLLFGVTPADPATFATILLVLGGAVVLAGWLPARRATRLDPTLSLRAE